MSHKPKILIATLAIVATLLAALPGFHTFWEFWETYAQHHTQTQPPVLNPEKEAALAGAKVPVIQFQSDAETTCYPYVVPDSAAFYCPLENTIYFGSQLNALPYPVRIFIYAHENGHAISTLPSSTSPRRKEQEADYHGGQVIKSLVERHVLQASDVKEITDWISNLKANDEHDSGSKRVQAFLAGYDS